MRHLIQLCLLVTLLLLPADMQAQFTFTTNNGAITITGYTGTGGLVIIPDITNGYPVKNIGNYAFESFETGTTLTNVIIPDSVTNIGFGAFSGCSRLTNVVMSTNVTDLPGDVFIFSGLTSFSFPSGITNIGPSAFDSCTQLSDVIIPNGVLTIGPYAFSDCHRLTTVVIRIVSQALVIGLFKVYTT